MNLSINKAKILEKYMISTDTMFVKVKHENDISVSNISFFVYIYNEDLSLYRPYTPISWNNSEICFVIKYYQRNGISEYIFNKQKDDTINISQLISKKKYLPTFKQILMICGGTGITPMLQILNNEKNIAKFTIIDCNKTFNDILINRNIINKDLNIYYVLSRENETCLNDRNQYHFKENEKNIIKCRLSKEVLIEILKKMQAKPDFIYVCGPPGFMNIVSGDKTPEKNQGELTGILKDLGFDHEKVYKF